MSVTGNDSGYSPNAVLRSRREDLLAAGGPWLEPLALRQRRWKMLNLAQFTLRIACTIPMLFWTVVAALSGGASQNIFPDAVYHSGFSECFSIYLAIFGLVLIVSLYSKDYEYKMLGIWGSVIVAILGGTCGGFVASHSSLAYLYGGNSSQQGVWLFNLAAGTLLAMAGLALYVITVRIRWFAYADDETQGPKPRKIAEQPEEEMDVDGEWDSAKPGEKWSRK